MFAAVIAYKGMELESVPLGFGKVVKDINITP